MLGASPIIAPTADPAECGSLSRPLATSPHFKHFRGQTIAPLVANHAVSG